VRNTEDHLDMNLLRLFDAVYRLGSVSLAAEALEKSSCCATAMPSSCVPDIHWLPPSAHFLALPAIIVRTDLAVVMPYAIAPRLHGHRTLLGSLDAIAVQRVQCRSTGAGASNWTPLTDGCGISLSGCSRRRNSVTAQDCRQRRKRPSEVTIVISTKREPRRSSGRNSTR
jgi:hypothetical protein